MITLKNRGALERSVNNNDKGQNNMRDSAQAVYEKMRVGSVAWIRPVAAKGETLESFQAALESALKLAEEGLINIEKVQRQADGLVDAIRILRLS